MTHPPAEASDPIARFIALFEVARAYDRAKIPEPTAFTLATVGEDGRPSARVLLLKGVDANGFVFYTNYESRKGTDLLATPFAALCFHWAHLEVQVRVEGLVTPVSAEEADAYFATRPRLSQIGAWASLQSRPLASYAELEARVRQYEAEFAGRDVPRPPHWSGFCLEPDRMEFWKNMPSRLHHRDVYTRSASGWIRSQLYP
jgi:pyridoxamine 5'-phosphate oxidase